MRKASVCLILNGDYWGTRYSLERCGFDIVERKAEFIVKDAPKEYMKVIDNTEIELLVAYTSTSDKRLIEYFKPIATELIEVSSATGLGGVSDAQAYNVLFKKSTNDYICIFKPYVFLQKNWLMELMYSHQSAKDTGVVGICEDFRDAEFLPLPSPDMETFVNVFIPKEKVIHTDGVFLFLREHLFFVGIMDEESLFVASAELVQFQLRCVALALTNHYIPTQTCLITKKHNKTDFFGYDTSDQKIKTTLVQMKKNKSYYIPFPADL